MSFGDYNVRHNSSTSRDSFPANSKQHNSSMMMHRGSHISEVSAFIMHICIANV